MNTCEFSTTTNRSQHQNLELNTSGRESCHRRCWPYQILPISLVGDISTIFFSSQSFSRCQLFGCKHSEHTARCWSNGFNQLAKTSITFVIPLVARASPLNRTRFIYFTCVNSVIEHNILTISIATPNFFGLHRTKSTLLRSQLPEPTINRPKSPQIIGVAL